MPLTHKVQITTAKLQNHFVKKHVDYRNLAVHFISKKKLSFGKLSSERELLYTTYEKTTKKKLLC